MVQLHRAQHHDSQPFAQASEEALSNKTTTMRQLASVSRCTIRFGEVYADSGAGLVASITSGLLQIGSLEKSNEMEQPHLRVPGAEMLQQIWHECWTKH